MCIKMRFVDVAGKKKSVLCAAVAVVLLVGCGGGGKAGAGDYKLKVSVNPANGGNIQINPNMESYNEWMDVEVTATANKGYVFTGWSGDATDQSRYVTIKMSGNKNKKLTANFKAPSVSTFKDSRDGNTYKKVAVGSQTWMAENLNYAADNSVCYGNSAENCAKYGRLYNWSTAKTACPAGWHLPSDAEWGTLENSVGGFKTAGTKLKSADGWSGAGYGTDDYAFSALPGGFGGSGGNFYSAGRYGYWWSAAEGDAYIAWSRDEHYYDGEWAGRSKRDKDDLFSVRCVQD